jgi:hypothetical protein
VLFKNSNLPPTIHAFNITGGDVCANFPARPNGSGAKRKEAKATDNRERERERERRG